MGDRAYPKEYLYPFTMHFTMGNTRQHGTVAVGPCHGTSYLNPRPSSHGLCDKKSLSDYCLHLHLVAKTPCMLSWTMQRERLYEFLFSPFPITCMYNYIYEYVYHCPIQRPFPLLAQAHLNFIPWGDGGELDIDLRPLIPNQLFLPTGPATSPSLFPF